MMGNIGTLGKAELVDSNKERGFGKFFRGLILQEKEQFVGRRQGEFYHRALSFICDSAISCFHGNKEAGVNSRSPGVDRSYQMGSEVTILWSSLAQLSPQSAAFLSSLFLHLLKKIIFSLLPLFPIFPLNS